MNKDIADTFIKDWNSGQQEFTLRTSGSTGEPKSIVLEKRWMQWSASRTAEFMHPKDSDSLFCCLPLSRVGGLMMLVRSLEWQIPVEVVEPVANPLLKNYQANMISVTPYQLFHIINDPVSFENLLRFREVLIGGGELSYHLSQIIRSLPEKTIFRHSYGMTETYSHIALRTLNGHEESEWFTAFHDVKVTADEQQCAKIYTPFFKDGLPSKDIISLRPDGRFKVVGRIDFMINSGGVKLQAELIEQTISEHIDTFTPFIISSIKDDALGEKLVLVCEDQKVFEHIEFNFLKAISPYAVPKKIIELNPLPLNEGGKTDRLKIRELINM